MKKEHYSLNENELFILLDSFIKCNRIKEGQKFIYQNEIEVYDDVYGHLKSLWEKILVLSQDHALRNKTVEEIKALCDEIGIKYEDENTLLDETNISTNIKSH